MTTSVTVRANHGWPVDVTHVALPSREVLRVERVAATETREFHVHSGIDLLIHEVQPSEIAT